MLFGLIAVLLVFWLVGVVTAHTFGGLLHIFFVVALIVFVISLVSDRRVA